MGHVRLGILPRTRRWDDVVDLVALGAGARVVAAAAARAATQSFIAAADDVAFLASVWLLTQLPLAARATGDGYVDALRRLGLDIEGAPRVLELAAAMSEAVDVEVARERARTDVGELARAVASETLASVLGQRARSLFGTTADDVRRELARLATEAQFGAVAREFFARFTRRVLTYFLSRELSNHVGGARRFATLDSHAEFNAAIDLHCREASRIVEDFAGEWFSKTNWEHGIDRQRSDAFAFAALKKLRAELARRESET